jgi:hypothetical protein
MRNSKVIAALVAGIILSAAIYAQQKGGKTLSPQDYNEIQQLYARYFWIADLRPPDGIAYAQLFTQDGEFIIVGRETVVGRDKIAEWMPKVSAPNAGPSHYATNIMIVPSAEGARGGAFAVALAPGEANKPQTISTSFTYEDVLVKTSEGWRFKRRTVRLGMPPAIIGSSN